LSEKYKDKKMMMKIKNWENYFMIQLIMLFI